MKKKILSIALVLATVMGTSTVFAQTPDNATAAKEQKSQRGEGRKAEKAFNPFEGLNLSEKQQSELKALQDARKAERTKDASEKKADKKAQKEQRQAKKQDMMQQRQNDRKEYLAKIKGILNADQYVQFLENYYLNGSMMQGGDQKGPRMGQRDGKNGQKGQRDGKNGQKGQRDGQRDQRGDRQ